MESLYGMDLIDNLSRVSDTDFIDNYLNLEEKLEGNFLSKEVSDIMAQISGRNLEIDETIPSDLYAVKDIIISYIRDMVCKRTQEIYDLYEIRFIDSGKEYSVGVTGCPKGEKQFIIVKTGTHPKLHPEDVILVSEGIICSGKLQIPVEIIEVKDYFYSNV